MNSLLGKSIIELKKQLDTNQISSIELSSYFRKRIDKYDPEINSYVTVAEEKDGLPIAVKDNFCTKDLRTTASSKVLDAFIPPYESTVTTKLLNSGMQILGKTNMDAWAHGSSTETSDYGATKNPYDITRIPGGSSGGSAAAAAAYLAPAAIGSETAGSIRLPAAWCGMVGLKPTYGRVSRYGVIAMGSSLDCPGPITRTVEDAAYLLSIIAGHDPYDATSSKEIVPDYQKLLKEKKKLKIGVCDAYFENVNEEIKQSVTNAIEILKKMGHEIKPVNLISPKYAISVYTIIQRAEVSSNLARFDGVRYGNDRSYFGREAKKRIMLGAYTLSHGYYDAFYKKAQKVRTLIIEDFKKVFKDVDVLVSPATPMSALKLGDWENYPFFGETMDVLNEPAAVAGIPAISVPSGLDSMGLPIGIQFVGRHFDEQSLLQLAYQFEKETDFFNVRETALQKYQD
jgi:aspartyl-tRNA(Asn)/glutamyl-tRNA(Gln) amidotransferase subunit A